MCCNHSIILWLREKPITEFSADNWKSVEQDQRYHMLEDFYAKVELIGISADEIDYELEYGSDL